jgi:hypothetical protein
MVGRECGIYRDIRFYAEVWLVAMGTLATYWAIQLRELAIGLQGIVSPDFHALAFFTSIVSLKFEKRTPRCSDSLRQNCNPYSNIDIVGLKEFRVYIP